MDLASIRISKRIFINDNLTNDEIFNPRFIFPHFELFVIYESSKKKKAKNYPNELLQLIPYKQNKPKQLSLTVNG